ncbi:amidohydrolase family protein [Streptomyces sp. NPDC020096]
MRIITLEEHFISQRFLDTAGIDLGGQRGLDLSGTEVTDLGTLRLKHMDDTGIDVQALSHVIPMFAPLPTELDIDIARAANEQAHAAVQAHPDRFQAFAALPMTAPDAAVRELDHAINNLGFRGALINGRANGRFLDHPALYPVLERAAQLGVPLYLHPGLPTATLRAEHYDGFGPSVSYALGTAAWGWHAETGLHALRIIAAGIFDKLPNLHIILGHMGEMIPFMIDRADEWLTPAAQQENGLQRSVAQTFREQFWVTTSGMFSTPQYLLLHQVLGPDRLLFSVDYPFSPNEQGRAFLDALEVNPADKEKLAHINAEHLLRLDAGS